MSQDLMLDPREWDLDFAAGQRDGDRRVAQQIRITLLTFLGEWFLDVGWGIPYFDKIMIKGPRRVEIESIIRAKVMDVPGVTSVPSVEIEIDSLTRQARIRLDEIATRDSVIGSIEVTNG